MIKKIEDLILRALEKFFISRIIPYMKNKDRNEEIKNMIGTTVVARKTTEDSSTSVDVVSSGYIVHYKKDETLYSEFVTNENDDLFYIEKE